MINEAYVVARTPFWRTVWFADVLLVGVALVWGTSYGVAKSAVQLYPVLGFLAIRFGLTFLFLSPVWLKTTRRRASRTWRVGAPLGLILLAIFICETFGVARTRASNAAFLISLCVVFTPFVEALVLRSALTLGTLAVAAVSALGAFLLTSSMDLGFNLGDGLILMAAVLRACMVTFTKRLRQGQDIDSLTLTAAQSGIVALGCGALAFSSSAVPSLPTTLPFWGATLYLVFFCTIFAFFAQNYAVGRTSASRVSMLMGAEPLFGAIFAKLWLGEQLSWVGWVGGLLILGSTSWVLLQPARRA